MSRTPFILQTLLAAACALNVWFALVPKNEQAALNWAVAVFAGLMFLKRWD